MGQLIDVGTWIGSAFQELGEEFKSLVRPPIKEYFKSRKNQSERARKPRSPLPKLVATLVGRHPKETRSGELWPHFVSMLAEEGYDPEEKPNRRQPKKKKVIFTDEDGKERSCTFGTFSTSVSNARRNPSA